MSIQLLSVRDLIEALEKFKPTATVWVESLSDDDICRASGVQYINRSKSRVVITNGSAELGLNPCTDRWICKKHGLKSGPGTRRGDLRTGRWMRIDEDR